MFVGAINALSNGLNPGNWIKILIQDNFYFGAGPLILFGAVWLILTQRERDDDPEKDVQV